MKGIKTVAANLANRINQPHDVESVLRKVFNSAADHSKIEVENLRLENERLKNLLAIVKKYAIVEYGESAACRIIASEIQKEFPN